MKEINYALAPSDATDYDFFQGDYYYLKRTPNGKAWRYFHDDRKEWVDCDAGEEPGDYTPIPEREIALNRLADNYVDCCQDHRMGITNNEVKARRAERLEAGLIKENNDLSDVYHTHLVETEDDLTWLAKNLDNWPTGTAVLVSVDDRKTMTFNPRMNDYYSMREWLQRRRELGLDADSVADEPSQEWINGLPPMGVECEYVVNERITRIVEITAYARHGVCYCEKGKTGENYVSKSELHRFRPIKTAKQIAAEKRDEWIEEASRKFRSSCVVDYSGQPFADGLSAIYDALLSGELESPRVALNENQRHNQNPALTQRLAAKRRRRAAKPQTDRAGDRRGYSSTKRA